MGGQDKALASIDGQTLVQRALCRLQGQVSEVLLNTNRSKGPFDGLGVEIRSDSVDGFLGPLAGVLTGMEWARAKAGDDALLLSVAVDCPLFPLDLGERLAAVLTGGCSLVVARSGGRIHPVFGLWRVRLADDLRRHLTASDNRKVMDWIMTHDPAVVDWPTDPVDPFLNINTPDDLRALASDAAHGLRL
jgi:molybdopterin-guanine dinucleotide biosynthesis protein A